MTLKGGKSKVPWHAVFLLALAFLFSLPMGVDASDAVTVPLYAPEVFHRDPSKPVSVVRTFVVSATEGIFSLHVDNGDGATDNLVSSAVIKVNGATLVMPSDLSQNVVTLDKPLTNLVKGQNLLDVEVRSIPSSYITVSIAGTYFLGVTVTNPPPSASIASDKVTVQGTYVGYTGDVGVTVNGVSAAVTGSAFVAADVPLLPGNNTLQATVATFDGIRNTDAVTVSATGEKPSLALWANYTYGVPPFRGELQAGDGGDHSDSVPIRLRRRRGHRYCRIHG